MNTLTFIRNSANGHSVVYEWRSKSGKTRRELTFSSPTAAENWAQRETWNAGRRTEARHETPSLERPEYIEMWYDRRERHWVIRAMDRDECQIGRCEYATDKYAAVVSACRMRDMAETKHSKILLIRHTNFRGKLVRIIH